MNALGQLSLTTTLLSLFLTSLLCGQALELSLPEDEIEQGWIALFDGETLFGWKKTTEADWQVVDGAIQVSEGKSGLLRTTSQFDDYELQFEFRCAASTNSGVFLRTSPKPRSAKSDCYEFNIAPADNPFPTGSLVGRKKSEAFWQANHLETDWISVSITVDGDSITSTVDGGDPIEYQDESPLGRGFIGLQLNRGKIAFRNIKLRPLNLTAMLDDSLSNWNQDLAKASKFSIINEQEESFLQVTGGSGQLESNESYGDFIFSTRCRTNETGLNSGVFFRCIPGELMNGYESQIQNEMKDNDPTVPANCGTGGIFRRTTARKIVANDNEWFTKTIVATGPHMSVWVNGYQVTDWSDTREPNDNPRRGKRLTAGTICLQGHDPTTDINFADMGVRELTQRHPKER